MRAYGGHVAAHFANFGQAPITAWAADKKNQEIGAYNHLSLEQDMEGEFTEKGLALSLACLELTINMQA